MRWFKHHADARLMPEIRNVERLLGEAGYARAHKLFEFIAQLEKPGRGTLADSLSLDMRSVSIPLLAEMWGIRVRDARRTLEVFSSSGLIDAAKFRDGVIFVPSMLDALDEWARKRVGKGQLRSNSGVTPELLRIDQSQSQTRPRQEKRETNHHDDFSTPLDTVRLNFQKTTILDRARGKVTNINRYVERAQKSWDWEAETSKFLRDRAHSIISAEPALKLFDLAERLKQDAASNHLNYSADSVDAAIRWAQNCEERSHAIAAEIRRGAGPVPESDRTPESDLERTNREALDNDLKRAARRMAL
jgi:hypothetical protein